MCNRYRPASVTYVRDVFGFTLIESAPPTKPAIGPLQQGPFITSDRALVGQWGLIPYNSKTRKPTRANGSAMSTNNCRRETVATAWTFRGPWGRSQRCLIPALDYDEPYWPEGAKKCTWWRFGRADREPWALAGIWSEWTDPSTGEVIPSYTMLTQNCDEHELLRHFHKQDEKLPPDKQDKRSVVPIERENWDAWLRGSADEAAALIRLPSHELFLHGAVDPTQQVDLPI
jgi:putative SOS response-associated peptidase YedK